MIVVDTNVLCYLCIPGTMTEEAEQVLAQDADWHAPVLWRSEFVNVLSMYVRKKFVTQDTAVRMLEKAESLMSVNTHSVVPKDVLALASQSPCTAYDCEFVVLARVLRCNLVTTDRAVLDAYPEVAMAPSKFLA